MIRSGHRLLIGLLFIGTTLQSQLTAQEPPTDDTITFWVVEALREDPRVRFSNVVVASEQGTVALTGSVFSLAESHYARLIALKIQGVRRVSNQLTVETPERPDSELVDDLRRRILQSSSLRVQGLAITANAGQILIKGNVSSLTQREQATLLASEIRGVRAIENEMQVVFTSKRSDDEIASDVEGAMRRDVYLNTLPINISVGNGVVVLTGTVGNAYQRERATQEVRRVANVADVDNRLEVQWLLERGVRGALPRPSDQDLKIAVEAELVENLRINASDISVSATDGHISLRGSVGSFAEKQLAGESVMSVAGALWVSNLLAVRIKSRDDAEIANDIQFAFRSDYLLRGQELNVHVLSGAATLSGNLASANQKVHAAELAGRVRGVRLVNNAIAVLWTPKYRDAEIDARLKSRMQANFETRWVANQIKVDVESGKVTLIGACENLAQKREAGRVASLTDGVWAVDNQLTVENANYRWDAWHSDTPPIYYDAYPEYSVQFLERRF